MPKIYRTNSKFKHSDIFLTALQHCNLSYFGLITSYEERALRELCSCCKQPLKEHKKISLKCPIRKQLEKSGKRWITDKIVIEVVNQNKTQQNG